MQYERSITSGLEVTAKVKVFVHATDADGRAMTLTPRTYLSRLAKKHHYLVVFLYHNTNARRQVKFKHLLFGILLRLYQHLAWWNVFGEIPSTCPIILLLNKNPVAQPMRNCLLIGWGLVWRLGRAWHWMRMMIGHDLEWQLEKVWHWEMHFSWRGKVYRGCWCCNHLVFCHLK